MKIISQDEYLQYEPIGNKVLLVLLRAEPEKLENVGGVLVDQQAALRKNPVREIEVTAVGPECKQVRAGDLVMFNKLNAAPHPFGDHDLYFLPEEHLICITKKAPEFPKPVS
jgi:co-chaperonin GroES (HSP10)